MIDPRHELTTPKREWPPIDLGLEEDQDDDANVEWGTFVLTLCVLAGGVAIIIGGAVLLYLAMMVFGL